MIDDDGNKPRTAPRVAVVGGGLAGCEACWALARRGIGSVLFEMKPSRFSPAHCHPGLAELVCSNSLRSREETSAVGLLKLEMAELGSLIMEAAEASVVPAGKALAVDRRIFSDHVTSRLEAEPLVRIIRREVLGLDDPILGGFDKVIVTAGPLASESLTASLERMVGSAGLYFYDAIAPIVVTDSVDMSRAFWASRYNPEERDYLNCPMNESEYLSLVRELRSGRRVSAREFEDEIHFEGCLPVETMADRGEATLAFGPLKPVGLVDPRTGEQPFAVVQLRPENRDKTTLNMVGFQTKLTYPEQERVFRLIPGLERAEFERLGSIHRNTFVDAPKVLGEGLELLAAPRFHLAGQIMGVEGYLESAAMGLWLGISLCLDDAHRLCAPPADTALGALLNHVRNAQGRFQPSNVHFGLMPGLNVRAGKARRKELYAQRSRESFRAWVGKELARHGRSS